MIIIVSIVTCFTLSICNGDSTFWPTYKSKSRVAGYPKSAVSTDAAPCAPIGKDILLRNGSAVDAAIATLVCMGAHTPHNMGLGGGFLMVYYNRTEQKTYYIDSRETAPRRATADMFKGNATIASEGGLSIAVPGELAGYEEVHRKFGRLPWKDLFTPTIKMCRDGIIVSQHLANAIESKKDALMRHETIRNVFLKNGTDAYRAGERIKMPTLARTLEVISRQGMKALYGPSKMADNFLADLKAAGSIIDRLDMQRYAPRFRNPVEVRLRNNVTLHSVSMPGSGAILGFMLAVLDGYPEMNKNGSKSEELATLTYHRIVETFKYAYARRSQLEDENSEKIEQLIAKLISRDYADHIRHLINDSATYNPEHYGNQRHFVEDHGTGHLSVVAPDGDAVSVTSTINQIFGSKVMSPSTGIILNDEMDDFSSPNVTNYFDLKPTSTNQIRPGKKPLSSMSPSIFVDNEGNVTLVLGGTGGTMITTSVLQVASRVLFFDENIKQSIDAPRIHHQLVPDVLRYEKTFPKKMVENLSHFGHEPELLSTEMGSTVTGIRRGDDGYLYANSDYRKGGDVAGF